MRGFDFLIHARKFGMKLGLETMNQLSESLGNPEKKLRFIHIAGTNGKGSTAALCHQVLREIHPQVGLFTSPHLVSITERIQINHTPIPETTLTELLDEIAEISRAWEQPPSFFEIITACALLYFQRNNVDWVVWETGMGGRLDATNIVTPAVSIITSIGLDHQEYLGNSLSKIAIEKAGIIKDKIPVVVGENNPQALAPIEKISADKNAPFFNTNDYPIQSHRIQDRTQHFEINKTTFELSLLGFHQVKNAQTSYVALSKVLHIPDEIIQKGFKKTTWPGRFQILCENPLIVLDGAHNLPSTQALIETWMHYFPKIKPHLIFGALEDKEYEQMIEVLKPCISEVTLVPIQNPRTLSPESLKSFFSPLPTQCENSLSDTWKTLLLQNKPLLITGSLFLVGEALHCFHQKPNSPLYNLNESLKASP